MRQPLTVTAILAAYNEEDIIGPVVADLLDQGARVHLLDHASTDGTVAEVEKLRGRGSLTIERLPPGDFSLMQIIRRKEILAAELDSDWFVNADADEFRESPWPGVGFVEGLREVDRLGFNAVDFAVLNFLPVDESFHKGDDPRAVFRFCEPGGNFDRLQIRCWKKQPGPLDLVSTAGHEARFPDRRVFPMRFLLRHYPIRGQAHGERKVLQERLPRFAPDERARGWHVQYDSFHEGSTFLRESSSLLPFDPWSTRVALALRHRGVESLEGELARKESERDEARRGTEAIRKDLEASREAVAGWRSRAQDLERDLASTRTALGNQDAHVASLIKDREHQLVMQAELRADRDGWRREQERALGELQRLQGAFERQAAERERLLVAHAVLEAERGQLLRQREDAAVAREGLLATRAALDAAHAELRRRGDELLRAEEQHALASALARARIDALQSSRIWRWSRPLRDLLDRFSGR
jgi:hypothetical protein